MPTRISAAAHIRAAVEAAQYSSPDTTEAVIQILRERQHKILAHWFAQVAALDLFAAEGNVLCFSDLEELYLPSPKSGRTNRVSATSYSASGGNAQSLEVLPRGSQICLDLPTQAGYLIVRLKVARARSNGLSNPIVDVHLGSSADGSRQVVGVERH